ncbi:MAG: 3-oxoacyl-[acyl-carrier protein] reductase, partial [uncultured Thermomicrobiales bacterium]
AAGGESGGDHGRRARHRAADCPHLRAGRGARDDRRRRGRGRPGDRRRDRGGRRRGGVPPLRRDAPGRRAGTGGRRCGALRAARHPRQQRGDVAARDGDRAAAGRLGDRARLGSRRGVLRLQGRHTPAGRGGRGCDHHDLLRPRPPRRTALGGLRGGQGRADPPDEAGGLRLRPAGDPRQLHLPRPHPRREGRPGLRARPGLGPLQRGGLSAAPVWPDRGHRQRRALPGQRRGVVHHRPGAGGRRRTDGPVAGRPGLPHGGVRARDRHQRAHGGRRGRRRAAAGRV